MVDEMSVAAADEAVVTEDMIAALKGRAAFYDLLAAIYFRPLTAEQTDNIAEMDWSEYADVNELFADGVNDITRYLRKRNSGTRQALACDYAHTFLAAGNYETFAATPFESVFTSQLGLMMQEARDDVYKMYCEQGIQPQADLHVPEDHVSFEFEFLATVIERTNAALLTGDFARAQALAETVSDFHRLHQLNWIDDLCDAVLDVAETRFYRGVAKVTRGFVHMETEVVADELEVLQGLADKQAA